MCGLCGFVNLDGTPASEAILDRMNAQLVHRGPDDEGTYVNSATALGHRRLSIVDIARGHQPMVSSDGGPVLVYNGEVYNHLELRREALAPETHYRTTCDTETILAAYRQHGLEFVHLLRGMFALAIHDPHEQRLLLVRDRMGIKPLYYFQSARLFAFASEIKALLAHPDIAAEVNCDRLPVQLALKYTLDDQTLFRGIHKLLPGHWLELRQGQIAVQRYWDLSFEPKHTPGSMAEAATEFERLFNESVQLRLMADVPLGVFLSGGIDSSVIAAAMARMVDDPIQAYSVAFAENDSNELSYSRMVARHVGAEIHETVVTPEQWFAAWPTMVYHEDEPIAHPSSIPLHFVSKLAARDVKVVLTGEGADELLAGYERYYQTLANLAGGRLIPGPLRRVARGAIDRLPDRSWLKRKAVRTALYLPRCLEALFLDNYSALPTPAVRAALRSPYRAAIDTMYDGFLQAAAASDARELLDQILYADMKTYLLELLMKQDQMSMSASLESRVPFLDHHLVTFACRLPVAYKLRGFQTKRILRHALGHTVPPEIVRRSKKGFPTPIKQWFRGSYHAWLRELLLGGDPLLHEYIDRSYIEQVLDTHRCGRWDLQEQLWTLGNLEIWLQIFLAGRAPETIFPQAGQGLQCALSG